MSNSVAQRQGQPILFLGLLLTGWCLVRVLTWQYPWPQREGLPEPMLLTGVGFEQAERSAGTAPQMANRAEVADLKPDVSAVLEIPSQPFPLNSAPLSGPHNRVFALERSGLHASVPVNDLPFATGEAREPAKRKVSFIQDEGRAPVQSPLKRKPASHWRFDAWALLREGRGALSETGNVPASYGASQVGGVLAYRLAPESRFQPAAYLRASRALVSGGESEGAVGLRARPLAGLPLDLYLETRLSHRPDGMEVRPAVFVAGGIDRADMPAGMRLRGFAQAGYVHGDFSTAFADGKVVAEREVLRFGLGSASLGTGAWGGAQGGASRFDLGPTLAFDFMLGKTPARIEADYRFRIAGNAEPGSGGVLTLSTGF